MSRRWVSVAAVLGMLAVIAGTLGAHGFKGHVAAEQLMTYETGARYHMYHALALLATAWLMEQGGGRLARAAAWLFVAGVAIFSGSLYAMTLGEMYQPGQWKWLGAITPIGGSCFIAGWLCLLLLSLRRDPHARL